MNWPSRLIRRIGGLLIFALAMLVMGPLGVLFAVGETRNGRLIGLSCLTCVGAVACGLAAPLFPSVRGIYWACGALGLLGVSSFLLTEAWRGRRQVCPNPTPFGLKAFSSRSESKDFQGLPGSRTELIPESDQLHIGAIVFTALPFVSRRRAKRVRDVVLDLSRSVEADPVARDLGSVFPLAVAELLGKEFDSGHYFAYIPKHDPNDRLRAVVFLHGNAGNFKIMPWAWRGFCEREKMILVCPTFGFGFWNEGGVESVERARSDACQRLPIDANQIYLAGISDGGKGVTRSAAAHGSLYRGLIYISPTMILGELSEPCFADSWRGKPVFVAHGAKDWNVRRSTVDPAVELLELQSSIVEYHVYPEEDHFLFFSEQGDLSKRISAWMSSSRR